MDVEPHDIPDYTEIEDHKEAKIVMKEALENIIEEDGEFGEKTVTEKVKKKTVEKTVTDYDTIIFTPVKITTTDCFATEGRIFTLTRKQNENQS